MKSLVTNADLLAIRDELLCSKGSAKAWEIADLAKQKHNATLHESTIRGRFVEMGQPLSGTSGARPKPPPVPNAPKPATPRKSMRDVITPKSVNIPVELAPYIPHKDEFESYVARDIDKRLAMAYNIGAVGGAYKYPITQGKQGTGKTFSHMYYAFTHGLPFFLFSCFEDFKLAKLFGDKTIINGSIKFRESLFVKATQSPCCILFDEVNAISNAGTYDFHALLQNRELFIKDADDGDGKVYKLDPECRIGFAQNPKSAKYIGGNIKQSNFLGRCTYLSFPEFTKKDITLAIQKRFPTLLNEDLAKFVTYYFAIIEMIDKAGLPVDISIRQLINVIDLWIHGLPLQHSIEDGLSSILEAVSQPKAKESFDKIALAVWKKGEEI